MSKHRKEPTPTKGTVISKPQHKPDSEVDENILFRDGDHWSPSRLFKTPRQLYIAIGASVMLLLALIGLSIYIITGLGKSDDDEGATIGIQQEELNDGGSPSDADSTSSRDENDNDTAYGDALDNDSSSKHKHMTPKQINEENGINRFSGSSVELQDIMFPQTRDTVGRDIFHSDDHLTDDRAAIERITSLFQSLSAAVRNSPIDANTDGHGGESDAVASAIANDYVYGDVRIPYTLSRGQDAGWTFDPSQVMVFDYDGAVKKVTATWVGEKGEPTYLITGYYDPTIDSIKPASSNMTDAGYATLMG